MPPRQSTSWGDRPAWREGRHSGNVHYVPPGQGSGSSDWRKDKQVARGHDEAATTDARQAEMNEKMKKQLAPTVSVQPLGGQGREGASQNTEPGADVDVNSSIQSMQSDGKGEIDDAGNSPEKGKAELGDNMKKGKTYKKLQGRRSNNKSNERLGDIGGQKRDRGDVEDLG